MKARMRGVLAAGLAFVSLGLAAHAEAHAHPKTMAPAADAVVAAPDQVSMVFSEALEPAFSSLAVSDAAGRAVATGKVELDEATHTTMHAALPALASGTYLVKWIAVSRDGHRTSGSYRFTVK